MVDHLDALNGLPPEEVERELLKCCGSMTWAQQLIDARPFANVEEILQKAEEIWWSLDAADWIEAFRSHPKIGEKRAEAATTRTELRWSEQEQAGTVDSTRQALNELADLNNRYKERFGFIFIVCASGKASEEILGMLRQRLNNDPDGELRTAAAEQAKITRLRICKLLNYEYHFNPYT